MRGLALVLVVLTAPAAADEGEPKLVPSKQKPPPPAEETGRSHKGQFEASVRFGVGLRAIAVYDHDKEYCGQTDADTSNNQATVCTGRAPFAVDFEIGYGVARKIDLLLEARLGLEADFGRSPTDTGGTHELHLSPGARFFFSDSGTSKLFTTAQLVFDFSGYKDNTDKSMGADFGVRNLNGLWFDLDRAYGIYLFAGETATFARWLRFELEGGVGIQGRYR